jgi:hypothetical protein
VQTEAAHKLRAGGCKLYFDTNAIRGRMATNVKLFNDLCKQIKRLRTFDERAPRVCVFTVNYFEMAHQMRREIKNFDESHIIASLKTHDVDIVALDFPVAQNCAKQLHSWFPLHEHWTRAKQPANGRATIDWLISTHISASDALLVTDDGGPEFCEAQIRALCVSRTELTGEIESWLRDCNMPNSSP